MAHYFVKLKFFQVTKSDLLRADSKVAESLLRNAQKRLTIGRRNFLLKILKLKRVKAIKSLDFLVFFSVEYNVFGKI